MTSADIVCALPLDQADLRLEAQHFLARVAQSWLIRFSMSEMGRFETAQYNLWLQEFDDGRVHKPESDR